MAQPKGHEVKDKEDMICKLNKNIYGLKQAARTWNRKLDSILIKEGYKQSQVDLCLYSKEIVNEKVYIIIYVDDVIIASSNVKHITDICIKDCVTFLI